LVGGGLNSARRIELAREREPVPPVSPLSPARAAGNEWGADSDRAGTTVADGVRCLAFLFFFLFAGPSAADVAAAAAEFSMGGCATGSAGAPDGSASSCRVTTATRARESRLMAGGMAPSGTLAL